jgi:ribosomal protein S18 acetylase RimI-like enzyme
MSQYLFREATMEDVPFLAEVMISAEKSGTDRLGLATLCGISEEELRSLFIAMLHEEVDGCEYSVTSFLIAEYDGRPVAAVAAWIEGQPDGVPSMILKSNLLAFTFPPEHLKSLQAHKASLAELQIERERGTLQIEYMHVDHAHRGQRLAGRLIEEQIRRSLTKDPPPSRVQMQPYSNHAAALAAYERIGFRKVRTFTGSDAAMGRILPHTERLLMERPLTL